MKIKKSIPVILLALLLSGCGQNKKELGKLDNEVSVLMEQNLEGDWGISLIREGRTFLRADYPLHIEFSDGRKLINGFDDFSTENGILKTMGSIRQGDVAFHFSDSWHIENSAIKLDRQVKVEGNLDAGFMSGILFKYPEALSRDSVRLFAPGNIYGNMANMPPDAIGGRNSKDHIRIREDRLPAPLFGAYFNDGSSFTILNSRPDSRTIPEDSYDNIGNTLIDENFRFGAIGADFDSESPVFGYWFPGSEGGVTYKGRTKLQRWTYRFNPVKDGLLQEYQVSFKTGDDKLFRQYYANAFRWAWTTLKPRLNAQNIELCWRYLINMLGDNIETHGKITGVRKFIPLPLGTKSPVPPRTVMGFTGKSLEAASYLMVDGRLENNSRAEKHSSLGESIINTFLQLELAPPAGEGFYFTGEPALTRPLRTLPEPILFLRSFGDGLKELLKQYKREKNAGNEHIEWISWAKTFADWLLPQQSSEGGFPRAWKQGTGEVFDPSPETSYNVIPFLVLLNEITSEDRYLDAAHKAGEFCWNNYHKNGLYVGATLDNPNVIDKEAGTISMESYLMLYNVTSDSKWLERAVAAANYAETWLYIWNVPMPEDDSDLYWKNGVTTVGLQLITTGHSLTDMYMAFDVDEFAELYLLTGDRHYYDLAMILLHNTKAMLALPGREFDMPGPGWIQETWSLAPTRGKGILKAWLPWVTTSQLNGIIELQELDEELYNQMINP